MTPAYQDKNAPYALIEEIADLIGQDAADRLMLSFPGVTLYVPQKAVEDHAITRALGAEAAAKLSEFYGSNRLAIPTGKQRAHMANAGELARRAQAMKQEGVKIPDIATELGVTERRIYQIFARSKPDPRQGDIFLGWHDGMEPTADNDE